MIHSVKRLFGFGQCNPKEGTTIVINSEKLERRVALLEDGVLKMADRQAFAGSVATTDRLGRNMVQLAGVSLCDAVTMMTATPARVAGIDDRKGHILPGYDADIVLLDKDLQVKSVMAMGKIIK